jgi:hypothetical protein
MERTENERHANRKETAIYFDTYSTYGSRSREKNNSYTFRMLNNIHAFSMAKKQLVEYGLINNFLIKHLSYPSLVEYLYRQVDNDIIIKEVIRASSGNNDFTITFNNEVKRS